MKDEVLFTKNTKLLDEVLKVWPKERIISNVLYWKTEKIMQDFVAEIGGYQAVEESGRDFNNSKNGDLKTAITYQKKNQIGTKGWSIDINLGAGVVPSKKGLLQLVVVNVPKDRLDKFLIPLTVWMRLKTGTIRRGTRLECVYNSEKDTYSKINSFKKDTSFKNWCEMAA